MYFIRIVISMTSEINLDNFDFVLLEITIVTLSFEMDLIIRENKPE